MCTSKDDGEPSKARKQLQQQQPKLVPGRSIEGNLIINSLRPAQQEDHNADGKKKKKLVGIRGKWYDVTTFVPHHPGGDVILEFVGRDATAQFMAYHSPKVLAKRKPVGSYDFDPDKPGGEAMQGDWMKLVDRYEAMGYFQTPLSFVASRFAITFGFLLTALLSIYVYNQTSSWLVFVVGAVCLAGFWQQSGEYCATNMC